MVRQKEKNNLVVSANPFFLSRGEYSKLSGSCFLAFLGFRYLRFHGGTLRARLVESTLGDYPACKAATGSQPLLWVSQHAGEEFPVSASPFPVFSTGGQELAFKMPACSSQQLKT